MKQEKKCKTMIMNGNKNIKVLAATILSMSLLTVMAGAAVAPALGAVKAYFADADPLLVQLVVSMPALFIILTNLIFPLLCRHLRTRTIAVIGLLLYVVAGSGAFFADSLGMLLTLRALLGVSVGLIMPLSTGLLAYYFPPEEIAGLMGLSAAMNQMGGVVATLLAGLLAAVQWNYAFLVYLIGLIALLMVLIFLPNEKMGERQPKSAASHKRQEAGEDGVLSSKWAVLKRFHPSVVGMLLLMTIFFVYPTNFALTASENGMSANMITYIMVGLDVVAFFVGLVFGKLMQGFRTSIKYFCPIGFLAGYTLLAFVPSLGGIMAGSVFIGIANGIGVPYLNTIASIKGGKESTTTVMPMLSAALYLGQFLSPLIVLPLKGLFGSADIYGAYKIAVLLCIIFIVQTFVTRRFHFLPPQNNNQ